MSGESQKVLQSSMSSSVSGCSITCFCSLHLNMGFIIFTVITNNILGLKVVFIVLIYTVMINNILGFSEKD